MGMLQTEHTAVIYWDVSADPFFEVGRELEATGGGVVSALGVEDGPLWTEVYLDCYSTFRAHFTLPLQ